ncbi:MAG: hypothetical protein V4736_13765 [Bdellovibrionota bacterium]
MLALGLASLIAFTIGFLAPDKVPFGTWRMFSAAASDVCLIEFYESDSSGNDTRLNRFEALGIQSRQELLPQELVIQSLQAAASQIEKVCTVAKEKKSSNPLSVSLFCGRDDSWVPVWTKREICVNRE